MQSLYFIMEALYGQVCHMGSFPQRSVVGFPILGWLRRKNHQPLLFELHLCAVLVKKHQHIQKFEHYFNVLVKLFQSISHCFSFASVAESQTILAKPQTKWGVGIRFPSALKCCQVAIFMETCGQTQMVNSADVNGGKNQWHHRCGQMSTFHSL